MLGSYRKSVAVIALTGAMAVSAATPSEARWFGRGWGWGAAGVGIGLAAGAAIASAAASPYYGYGYGYPAYGYDYGYGYPGYAYGYGYGPSYASYGYDYGYGGYGYGGYGYGGPGVSISWGSPGYGYGYAPSYSRSYVYASRANPSVRVARSSTAQTRYANVRSRSATRAYALAPNQGVQSGQRIYRTGNHGRTMAVNGGSHMRAAVNPQAQPRARAAMNASAQTQNRAAMGTRTQRATQTQQGANLNTQGGAAGAVAR
jgi:hypothetical protein